MLTTTGSRKVSVVSKVSVLLAIALFALCASQVVAQTTEFSYQGKLNDGGTPANGSYDFEFRLFDVDIAGTALATQQRSGVAVAGGVFSVRLDFGANFNGQPRWLEVGVRLAGSADPFTTLNPRQPVTSAPYGIRSLTAGSADAAADAAKLGGIDASEYVKTDDQRLEDGGPPGPGSTHYIQNSAAQQAASNFNISGNGIVGGNLSVAGTFSAPGQLVKSLNGLKDNVALAAGSNITITPSGNTLTIASAGGGSVNAVLNQTTQQAGANFNIAGTGTANTFNSATHYNIGGNRILSTPGAANLFAGQFAGQSNTTGGTNVFIGFRAGATNSVGGQNIFAGALSGRWNTTGEKNSFFGSGAGYGNTTGDGNTFLGDGAGADNTTGSNNVFIGRRAGDANTSGNGNTVVGVFADVGSANLSHATAIGAFAVVNTSNTVQLGRGNGNDDVRVPGRLVVGKLGSAGSAHLCRNAANQLAPCSSSLRYKTDIAPFSAGLNLVQQLRPLTFRWKDDGARDLGLGAEEVERIEPLLVTYNSAGQVEGVKYDRVAVVLLNAVREQQAQIRQQQQQLEQQQLIIDGLRQLVCRANPQAQVCAK
ncbi:MAG TPA: tail fiber domain-containing protein [Pyrinomonadaceae bacterium]